MGGIISAIHFVSYKGPVRAICSVAFLQFTHSLHIKRVLCSFGEEF